MSTSKPRRIITRTPEQQQRKRVQDREAQRVSRERTKALIGELEQQVHQLQADHSQCHEQLQACARERNDALAEADEARKRAQVAEHKLSLLRGRLTSTLNLISEDDDSARSSATQASSSRDALGTPSLDLTRQVSTTETSQVPVWSLDTRTIEATCPLDSILLKLLHSRRELVRGGESEDVAAGPIAPSFAALLGFRSLRSAHETCQIFTNIITTMEAVHRLPEQVAVIWIMYKLMRWQIKPTLENYRLLPSWIQPLPIQHSLPHPAWMDYVPFPTLRETIIRNHEDYDQDDFFLPYARSFSVNWPRDGMEAVSVRDHDSEVVIDPAFEKHITDIENWSLGPLFAARYPALVGTFRPT